MSRTITKNRATNEKKVCIESSSSAAPSQTATSLLDCATSTNCDRDGDCRGIETPRENAALALMNAMSCSAPTKLVQQMMAVKRPYDSHTALRSTVSKRLHLTKRNAPALKANKFSSICVGGGGGALRKSGLTFCKVAQSEQVLAHRNRRAGVRRSNNFAIRSQAGRRGIHSSDSNLSAAGFAAIYSA